MDQNSNISINHSAAFGLNPRLDSYCSHVTRLYKVNVWFIVNGDMYVDTEVG
jgi:hypothetical protein